MAESKPLVIQADVLKRELESCLRREYTPENLPLLLLQVGSSCNLKTYLEYIRKESASWLLGSSCGQVFWRWVICRLGVNAFFIRDHFVLTAKFSLNLLGWEIDRVCLNTVCAGLPLCKEKNNLHLPKAKKQKQKRLFLKTTLKKIIQSRKIICIKIPATL